ncbi:MULTISPECIES: hypothetical protein [Streptomyces]|nr:hypothetical protein [Streptomyces fradiae]UQS31969.1 hypothetical protein J5J01_10510 [Streptomyces fradiae]
MSSHVAGWRPSEGATGGGDRRRSVEHICASLRLIADIGDYAVGPELGA